MSSETVNPDQLQPSQAASSNSSKPHWVGSWYAAPTSMLAANLSGRTLRQIIPLHASGDQIRLHFSNRYGNEPVILTFISVGYVLQGPVVVPNSRVVTFQGQTRIVLEPGQEIVSDPVTLRVEAFTDLAVTFYLAQGENLTGHGAALQNSYISGIGDFTAIPAEMAFFVYPLITQSWWVVSGIDVLPATPLNAVVAFGSSTTDGSGSTVNANKRWPDYLARRLTQVGSTRNMPVINAGIGGNQLTASQMPGFGNLGMDALLHIARRVAEGESNESRMTSAAPVSENQPATSQKPFLLFGEAGKVRFEWDVMTQPGATDLIFHIGSNDLRSGVAALAIIETYQELVTQARNTYKKVFGTTILPGGYSPEQQVERQIVNRWLIEQGPQWFDAIFDFAAALQSRENEAVIHPAYDSGDGIHPNDEGYRLMAEAVSIDLLTGSPSQAGSFGG